VSDHSSGEYLGSPQCWLGSHGHSSHRGASILYELKPALVILLTRAGHAVQVMSLAHRREAKLSGLSLLPEHAIFVSAALSARWAKPGAREASV
jgi:hypothetical protein